MDHKNRLTCEELGALSQKSDDILHIQHGATTVMSNAKKQSLGETEKATARTRDKLLVNLPPVVQKIIRQHWQELEQELESERLIDMLECLKKNETSRKAK